jgi:hypothetical protein
MKIIFAIIACLFVSTAEANYQSTALESSKANRVNKVAKKSQVKKHLPVPRTLKPLAHMDMDEDDDYWDDVMDLQVSYRRPELISNDDLPLSDYVRLRLAHARRLALDQYRRIWG